VVRTLNFIFQQAKMCHVPVSVCGELAADPLFAPLLIGLGAQELSVSMGAFPRIKYLLRRISLHDAKHLAIRVLRCEDPDQILGELEAFYEKAMGEAIETLKGF